MSGQFAPKCWAFLLCLVVAPITAQASACVAPSHAWTASPIAEVRPQILVVGVYHMANPGLDIADPTAGNVLHAKRQAQIQQVVAVLKKFHPTKVAVERLPDDPKLTSNYGKYRAGKLALDDNEIQQIGFRLAKEIGLKAVCGVDYEPALNFGKVKQYATAAGLLNEYSTQLDRLHQDAQAQTTYLRTHTILQMLERLNSCPSVAQNVATYYQMVHFSAPGDWGAVNLISAWYHRNLRIYANILHLIGSPHARILVIFGFGHLGWLRHDFASDPSVRLRKLSEFAH